jgi:cardiolipin synthase
MPNLTSTPQLLDAVSYVADLTARVSTAKKRIIITSMIINDDPSTNALIAALMDAARRGVSVDVMFDTFTFREFGGYFNPFRRLKKRSRQAIATMRRLESAGVAVTLLGKNIIVNPFAGVTHIKWSVVDSDCYAFGGVNLYHEGVHGATDYMIRIDDATLADQIAAQQQAIQGGYFKGYEGQSSVGNWLVDSGFKGESIIYDRAVSLASEAESIVYISQYCPSGALVDAMRGTSGEYYFNTPISAPFPTNLMLWYDQKATGIYSAYKRQKYLHAKCIIFTMPGGKKIALTGSHNFSYKGVQFGTREVALETDHPVIIEQIENFLQDWIK